jgi:hypothetical protein
MGTWERWKGLRTQQCALAERCQRVAVVPGASPVRVTSLPLPLLRLCTTGKRRTALVATNVFTNPVMETHNGHWAGFRPVEHRSDLVSRHACAAALLVLDHGWQRSSRGPSCLKRFGFLDRQERFCGCWIRSAVSHIHKSAALGVLDDRLDTLRVLGKKEMSHTKGSRK